MPKTYTTADKTLVKFIADVMEKYHQPLAEAGVTVSALMVSGGLKHHGYAAHAVVKINALKDRVEGKADCTITFDGDDYDNWPESMKAALIDHELEHVAVVKDDKGRIEKDDCGRPKLRMRLHDVVVGGFQSIIERHKEAAIEAQAIASSVKYVQGFFKW